MLIQHTVALEKFPNPPQYGISTTRSGLGVMLLVVVADAGDVATPKTNCATTVSLSSLVH